MSIFKKNSIIRVYCIFSIILIQLLCNLQLVNAQSIDSLENIKLNEKISIEDKIAFIHELCIKYASIDPNRTIALSELGLKLCQQYGDQLNEGIFNYHIASAYYRKYIPDSVEKYLEKAMINQSTSNNEKSLPPIYELYGKLYRKQGKYREALEKYQDAIRIYEKNEDKNGLGKVYLGIGGVYQLMKNYTIALNKFELAENLFKQTNNIEDLGKVYISYSGIYSRLGEEKEKCIRYAKDAAKIFNNIGDIFNENEALQTISHVYFLHKDYDSALVFASKSVEKVQDIDNNYLKAYSLIILSNIYFEQKKYIETVSFSLKALYLDSVDINLKMNVFSNLSKSYAYLNEPQLAEQYSEFYHQILLDYSNQTYQNSLSELEIKYETEKNKLKIESLEKQKLFYSWIAILVGAILIILLALIIIRYRWAENKRKLAEKESIGLEQEKQLIAIQATLDGESAERSRLARDLHDGLGSMLSVVKLNLPQIKGNAILESVDVTRFKKAIDMLDNSIVELRRVAHHIMPETLLRYGLKVSLLDFCDSINSVNFHYYGNESRLSEKLEILVYRCIHELVNNSLKHSKATQINVQLVQEEDRISFTVQDDGVGFNEESIREGMGLRNIRQRVESFNGKMSIYSSHKGTEINIEIEYNKWK